MYLPVSTFIAYISHFVAVFFSFSIPFSFIAWLSYAHTFILHFHFILTFWHVAYSSFARMMFHLSLLFFTTFGCYISSGGKSEKKVFTVAIVSTFVVFPQRISSILFCNILTFSLIFSFSVFLDYIFVYEVLFIALWLLQGANTRERTQENKNEENPSENTFGRAYCIYYNDASSG